MAALSAAFVIALIRAAWLVLAGMMLFSRIGFQRAGARWMRAFLNQWKVSATRRVWGIGAFTLGLAVLTAGLIVLPGLRPLDIALGLLLIAVLVGDGLLNFLPSSFSNFKERMQDAWVRRNPAPEQADDSRLFGVVNLLLGAASLGMEAFVIFYRPISVPLVVFSALCALLLTGILVRSCLGKGKLPLQGSLSKND